MQIFEDMFGGGCSTVAGLRPTSGDPTADKMILALRRNLQTSGMDDGAGARATCAVPDGGERHEARRMPPVPHGRNGSRPPRPARAQNGRARRA